MKTFLMTGLVVFGLCAVASAADFRASARANNQFGVNLFKAVAKRTAKGNKFLSPTSAYVALSLAYNGMEGSTLDEAAAALASAGRSPADFNAENEALLSQLNSAKDYELSLANAVFARQGFRIKEGYLQTVRGVYGASLDYLDFNLPASIVQINDWVKAKTKNKIDSIVERLEPALRLLLVNATYFEAKWTIPFEAALSREAAFARTDGSTVSVPSMFLDARLKYRKTADYEAVELPYGMNAGASMIVVVPSGTLAAYESSLTGAEWERLTTDLDAQPLSMGQLQMPSLELSYDTTLVPALKAIGLREAFTDAAQFGALTDDCVAISEVLQKTYLRVFEEGTIAAAVTSIGIRTTSLPAYDWSLKVNRPYLVGIREKQSGTLLFLGTVVEPEGGRLPTKL